MKKTRLTKSSGYVSLPTLLLGFLALTVMIMLVALPVSCASIRKTSRSTGKIAAEESDKTGGTIPISGPAFSRIVQPLGTRPAHLRTDPLTPIPNQQALTRALWAPGIDQAYVPQGLTLAEGQLLMSAYRSSSPVISMGPCRVYRVDPESGNITGYFDLPPACGHAGGLAYAGGGVLILSDTRRLYRIDLEQALIEGRADKAITGILDLGGALRGSFVAFVPARAWPGAGPGTGPGMFVGTWATSATRARGYFLSLGLFDTHKGATITEAEALSSIPLDARAQGGAFAPDGSFWLSYSSHDFGRIDRVDPASGRVLAGFSLVSGTEDISFDESGGLWAVSEAGSLRWRSWKTSFPIIFRLDPTLLE